MREATGDASDPNEPTADVNAFITGAQLTTRQRDAIKALVAEFSDLFTDELGRAPDALRDEGGRGLNDFKRRGIISGRKRQSCIKVP